MIFIKVYIWKFIKELCPQIKIKIYESGLYNIWVYIDLK